LFVLGLFFMLVLFSSANLAGGQNERDIDPNSINDLSYENNTGNITANNSDGEDNLTLNGTIDAANNTLSIEFYSSNLNISKGGFTNFFINISTMLNSSISYLIIFGDGGSASNSSASTTKINNVFEHVYSSGGNYTARLIVYINDEPAPERNLSMSVNEVIFKDVTPPDIILIKPENNEKFGNININFSFRAEDNIKVENCTLKINDYINESIGDSVYFEVYTNVTKNTINLELKDLGENNYLWNVSCYDDSSNKNDRIRYFEVKFKEIISSDNVINENAKQQTLELQPNNKNKDENYEKIEGIENLSATIDSKEDENDTIAAQENIEKESSLRNSLSINNLIAFFNGEYNKGFLFYLAWILAFSFILYLNIIGVEKTRIGIWKRKKGTKDIFEIMKETKRSLKNENYETAGANYQKLIELSPELPIACKKITHKRIEKLRVGIDNKEINHLINKFFIAIDENKNKDVFDIYKNIQGIYGRLPAINKQKVYEKVAPYLKASNLPNDYFS